MFTRTVYFLQLSNLYFIILYIFTQTHTLADQDQGDKRFNDSSSNICWISSQPCRTGVGEMMAPGNEACHAGGLTSPSLVSQT